MVGNDKQENRTLSPEEDPGLIILNTFFRLPLDSWKLFDLYHLGFFEHFFKELGIPKPQLSWMFDFNNEEENKETP